MEAHPGQGQRSLALYGLFKRPCTLEDGPLLSIKQIRFTQMCKQGCSRSRRWSSGQRLQEPMPQLSGLWAGRVWIQQRALLMPQKTSG
eukprot:424097-Pelagomonas_calceolata.AAC.3